MKSCHRPWMLVACASIAALLLLLPWLGVNAAGAGIFLTLLMVGCCVLPMLLIMAPRGEGKGGCCGAEKPGPSQTGPDGEKADEKETSCH